MISTREIKNKIRSIRSIQQMCAAMKTVSNVKLQRAESRLKAAKPYADKMQDVFTRLRAVFGLEAGQGAEQTKTVVVMTADKGLCGGFNSALIRRASEEAGEASLITIGRKGDRYFRRRGYNIVDSVSHVGTEPTYRTIVPVADRLSRRIKEGETSEAVSVYAHYIRGSRNEPTAEDLLPESTEAGDVIIEPRDPALMNEILGRYMRAKIYAQALENSASEHGARVAAMSSAADNAGEMIHSLTQDYNRARQESITGEITELTSAAEALRQ